MATGRRLNTDLLHLVDDLTSSSIGLQRFVVSARRAIRNAYYITYSLGAVSIFPFYTITDRDISILDEALNEETGFLRQFGQDLRRGRIHLDTALRARLYLLALRGIFERGRTEAMPDVPYRWALGPTEHCLDCISTAAAGPYQKYRNSGFGLPILPGAPGDGSVCQGLTLCGCRIVLASGNELPNQSLADRMRGLLLEASRGTRTASQVT